MQKDDYIRLKHMLDASNEAVSFIQERSKGPLDTYRKLELTLVKSVEIIGEADIKVT
ncbi:MAG: hypothetical protein ACUVWP_08420 [bacterium]